MTIKKIIKFIKRHKTASVFLAMAIMLAIVIPVFSAYAQGDSYDFIAEQGNNPPPSSSWIAGVMAKILYAILRLFSFLVTIAGYFFDAAINLALGDTARALFTDDDSVVVQGWQVCRDVANIFFLFALLYIGISMILQLTTYGSKKILLGVIIAALLVNFSLPVTRVMIDASNVISMEFVCKMTEDTCEISGDYPLSAVLAEGLSFQSIFGVADEDALASEAQEEAINVDTMVIALIFGIIILLVAAFVIFAGGVLVLIRTVILMILTIFSPLAFLFMALPGKAGSYANMWWEKLLKQLLFLPVYLFMLYLVVMMVNAGSIENLSGSSGGSFLNVVTNEGEGPSDTGLVIQYIIMIILLIGSLVAAQTIGAIGASGMIKLGGAARKRAVGYAGRGARRVAGKPAEAFATGKAPEGAGRFMRAMAATGKGFGKAAKYIPGAGYAMQGVTNITAANRAKVAEIQKGMEKNNDAELKSLLAASSGFTRTAAANILAKRENLTPGHGTTSQHLKALPNYMRRYGMETEAKNIEKLNWQYPETDAEREAIVQQASPAVMRKIMENEALSSQYLKTPGMINKMQESFRPEHYKAIYEANTAASHEFFRSLTEGSKSIEEMAQKLENLGTVESRRSATWATSTSAGAIMETYLPPQPSPPPQSPPPPPPKEGAREYAEEQWKRSSKK